MPNLSTAVDCTWTNGMTMDEAELRRADTAFFLGDGTPNGVRGGVVRHGNNSLAVTVNGSDQVTVQPGAFVIPAATGLGVYRGTIATATTPTAITARNATNPRIDLVVIQIVAGQGQLKTIDGTPSSSPVAPALPAQHIEIVRLSVPAVGGGAVTVDYTFRTYATSLGGTLYVETVSRLPGSGNQKGQSAIALDTGNEYVWGGTNWASVGVWVGYAPSWSNVTGGNGSAVGAYVILGKTVHFWARFTLGSTSVLGSNPYVSLPVAAKESGPITAMLTDSGSNLYAASATLVGGGSAVGIYGVGLNGAYFAVSATSPFTWTTGDVLDIRGTYEAA